MSKMYNMYMTPRGKNLGLHIYMYSDSMRYQAQALRFFCSSLSLL